MTFADVTMQQLARCPLRPDQRTIRVVLEAVLDSDVGINHSKLLPHAWCVIILAYKLLTDVGVDQDYAIGILKYFRSAILSWSFVNQLMLSINDNRYAMLIGPHDAGGYDYKTGLAVDTTRLPVPLLQASVNLSGLSALIG